MDSKTRKKKTEKALSKSEELFRATFEQAAPGPESNTRRTQ
jgi:hypothetical protein